MVRQELLLDHSNGRLQVRLQFSEEVIDVTDMCFFQV